MRMRTRDGLGFRLLMTVVVVLVAAAPVSAADVGGIDVQLPIGRSISGTITDGSGGPVANVSVDACNATTGSCSGGATTSGDGTYTVRGLGPGGYKLSAFPPDGGPLLFGYWTPGGPVSTEEEAAIVDVSGADATGIDLALATGFQIEGTVTDAAGNPVEGILVSANGPGPGASDQTDALGQYLIRPLQTGTFTLDVRSEGRLNYLSGPYVDGAVGEPSSDGTEIQVDANVTGIDIVVQPGLRLAGNLTGIADPSVVPTQVIPDGDPFGYAVDVEADGDWQIVGLRPGQYKIVVQLGDDNGTFLGYWRSDGTLTNDYDAATAIDLVDADVTGLDATIPVARTITGRVTDDSAAPIANAFLFACADNVGCHIRSSRSDGMFTFDGIRAGQWRLFAGARDHVSGYYGPNGFVMDHQDASLITVGNSNVSGIHVVLPVGFHIGGRITGPAGEPVSDAQVARSGGIDQGGGGVDRTDGNGDYRIGGVTPGTYTVFVGDVASAGYLRGYYSATSPGGYSAESQDATEIVVEATPPTVVSAAPASGATNVSRNTDVQVTFDRGVLGVDRASITLLDGRKRIQATVVYDMGTRTATLSPRGPLRRGAVYEIRLGAQIHDYLGISMAPTRWTFTTAP
jgi:hypothetical protein